MSAASPSCWNLLDTLHSSDYERHRYWESGSGWVSSGTRYSWRRARDHYRQAKRSEKRHLRSAPPSLKVLVKTGLRSVSGKKKQKLEKKRRKTEKEALEGGLVTTGEEDGNGHSPLQPINTRSSWSFNMKKHTKLRLKSSSIRGMQASEAMHTQPMESEGDNAMKVLVGVKVLQREFWQNGESWLDGLNWTSVEVGQHALHKAGTGSLAHSLDGFLLPVEEIVAEGRAVVLVNLDTAGLLLVTNFRLFFLGEGAKQLVPLGTIPLATIEKVTKLVSRRNYKFWLSSKSLMLSNFFKKFS
ncbi:unnamed protein product [Sphagnum troendelagicum]